MHRILRQHLISMACIHLCHSAVRVHDSQAYRKMDVTKEQISLYFYVNDWPTHAHPPFTTRTTKDCLYLKITCIDPWDRALGKAFDLHRHLFLNHGGGWGTTDDFTNSFLHFFFTAFWDLVNSRPLHSLMLSSHLFFLSALSSSHFHCALHSPDVILCGWLGSKHQLTN